MAEVHAVVSGVVVHLPAQHPLPVSAGKPLVAAVKPVGQPNGAAHGQVPNTSVVFDNGK